MLLELLPVIARHPCGREVWRDGMVRNRRAIVLGWGWAM
jgi:hypothetical protein